METIYQIKMTTGGEVYNYTSDKEFNSKQDCQIFDTLQTGKAAFDLIDNENCGFYSCASVSLTEILIPNDDDSVFTEIESKFLNF